MSSDRQHIKQCFCNLFSEYVYVCFHEIQILLYTGPFFGFKTTMLGFWSNTDFLECVSHVCFSFMVQDHQQRPKRCQRKGNRSEVRRTAHNEKPSQRLFPFLTGTKERKISSEQQLCGKKGLTDVRVTGQTVLS